MNFEKYKVLTESQVVVLKEIAALCPHSDGPAVYTARALLRGTDNNRKEYLNECERIYPNSNSSREVFIRSEGVLLKDENEFILNPNPAKSIITLVHNGDFKFMNIIEISGNVVFESAINNGQRTQIFDISNLANGIYIITLIADNKSKRTKLVISK